MKILSRIAHELAAHETNRAVAKPTHLILGPIDYGLLCAATGALGGLATYHGMKIIRTVRETVLVGTEGQE